MSVSWEKVRLVGQFEILTQDNLFSRKVRLVGQFFLRSCPTGRTLVYEHFEFSESKTAESDESYCDENTKFGRRRFANGGYF